MQKGYPFHIFPRQAKFVPVKPVRKRAQFRPTSLPASTTTPVSLLELEDSSGAALQEEERRLEEKLVKLAILEEELEHLEQVNRLPKQIKEQDQKTRKSRKRLKKRRRKPVDQGLSALAPLSNGLGRSVEEKGRRGEQGGQNLEGPGFSSVFIQPVATRTPLVLPTPLPPSPLPLPSQPIRIPSPRRHSPSVTSPLLPSSLPLTTSIPIFRSPIQFAAPASSHPNLPVSRTPTASLPSLPPQHISHPFPAPRLFASPSPLNSLHPQPFTPPFPAPRPFPSTSSFPRFHLPQFFSIPFPEMRQGRSSPTEGGLFNAIGLPRVGAFYIQPHIRVLETSGMSFAFIGRLQETLFINYNRISKLARKKHSTIFFFFVEG